MKKIVAIVLAAATVSSVMFSGGCAKKTNGAASQADSNAPITLSITWWGSQSRHDYTQKLLDMYKQQHPNISFQAAPAGWDGYQQKISAEAAGNSLPDIVQTATTFIVDFSKNGSLADLTPYTKDKTLDLSDADQNLVNSGKVSNKLTGVVLGTNALAMTYNPDVLSKAGLSAPSGNWTWNDFMNDCTTIQQKTGVYGVTELYSNAMNMLFAYYLRQYNEHLYSTDGSKLGYTDDKRFVDFVTMLKKLQDAKAMPNPDQETQITAKGKEARPVVTGQAGFIFEWSNYPTIVASSNSNLKMVMLPNDNSKVKPMYNSPSQYFSVSQSSKYKKQAAEFISWFVNDINANKIINAERGVPISSKVRDALKPGLSQTGKDMFDYIDQVSKNSSECDPPDPAGSAEVVTALQNEVSMVLYGKENASAAAAQFRSEANSALSRNAS